jgi:hypothetical protein
VHGPWPELNVRDDTPLQSRFPAGPRLQ